jgi:hypothetical protein
MPEFYNIALLTTRCNTRMVQIEITAVKED